MGASSSRTTSVDATAGQLTMPRGGNSGSHKLRRTESAGRGPSSLYASEVCGGPEAMAVNDVDGNQGDSVMFDMPSPDNSAKNAAKEALLMAPETSTCNWQLSDLPNFVAYAKFILNSGGESAVVGDNDRYCLLNLVKFLDDTLRATSFEKSSFLGRHRAEISQMTVGCERKVAEVQVTTEAKLRVFSTQLEMASNEKSEALSRLDDVEIALTASTTELQECKKQARNLQTEVKEKAVQIEKSNIKAAELGKKLRLNQDENAMEVERLKTAVTQTEKAMKEVTSERNLLVVKCSKLETQIAVIEQRAALDSTSSGSYAEDRANPSMLQDDACKSVDKATEALTKILHQNSITSKRRDSDEKVDLFVRAICPAKLGDFARPVQVKYIWSYRICSVMFRGFEHCFFDIDGGQLTSPLDAKLHALKSFEFFQLKKAVPSLELYTTCDMFREFCTAKYAELFPPDLLMGPLNSLFPHDSIRIGVGGRFSGDAHIFNGFLDVAKAVWLLHELAFAFDPPVSILRMARGEAFDKQFHESVVIDEASGGGSSKVLLMIRPGFRVRNTIIRSRVFLANL